MALPRWMLLTPLAALIATGFGARVASCSRTGAKSRPAQNADPVEIQRPRAFDLAAPGASQKDMQADVTNVDAFFLAGSHPFALFPSVFQADSPFADAPEILFVASSAQPGAGAEPSSLFAEGMNGSPKVAESKGRHTRRESAVVDADEPRATHWVSPRYEKWHPAAIYGPPLSPQRERTQAQAHRLLQDLAAGRLSVMIRERDGEQLRCLERNGVYCWPAPPFGVVVRTPRQREVLEGTTEDAQEDTPRSAPRMQLASRGALTRAAVYANRADDPDFDPCICPPAPGLLRMLTTLAAHSTPARPLEVMSLLRPPYRYGGYVHVGAANPHSMGLAVDIAAYSGHAIRQSSPEDCVAATLALLRDLPPGRYRLGMPKAPEGGWNMPTALVTLLNSLDSSASSETPADSDKQAGMSQEDHENAVTSGLKKSAAASREETLEPAATGCAIAALYGLHHSAAKPAWPFFPPPYTETVEVADGGSSGVISRQTVLRFQNEAYAPEDALIDMRLRHALDTARKRGVEIVALFPDGADHIHIDVRQNP